MFRWWEIWVIYICSIRWSCTWCSRWRCCCRACSCRRRIGSRGRSIWCRCSRRWCSSCSRSGRWNINTHNCRRDKSRCWECSLGWFHLSHSRTRMSCIWWPISSFCTKCRRMGDTYDNCLGSNSRRIGFSSIRRSIRFLKLSNSFRVKGGC